MPNVLLRIYRWYDNFLTLSKSNIQKLRKKRAEWQARNENINCNNWKTLRAGIFAVDLCKTTTVWWAHARKINKWSTKPCRKLVVGIKFSNANRFRCWTFTDHAERAHHTNNKLCLTIVLNLHAFYSSGKRLCCRTFDLGHTTLAVLLKATWIAVTPQKHGNTDLHNRVFFTSMCQNASPFVICSMTNFCIRRRKVSRTFFSSRMWSSYLTLRSRQRLFF